MPKENNKPANYWICGEDLHTHPKHLQTWHHGIISYIFGVLGSTGMGVIAVKYQVVTNVEETVSSDYDAIGYFLFLYQLLMIVSRCYVKGPEELYNQLWACNVGMTSATYGIIMHKPVMVGASIGCVALDQFLWWFDCFLKLTTGKFKIGVAKYLEWPETGMVQKITSWHHLWFLPLCIYYLRMTGPGMPTGALPLSLLAVISMSIVSRIVTPKDLNINMSNRFWKDIKISALHRMNGAPFWLYIPFLIVVYNCMNLPWWPLIVWFVGGNVRVVG
jgi:hypothetical protein